MIQERAQKFLGISELQTNLINALNSIRQSIVDACYEVLTAREPYLACVTFMGDTFDEDPRGLDLSPSQLIPTAFGAEEFISPGETKTLSVPVHRHVGHITYFVSGHPNIVIIAITVGNDHQTVNSNGIKFGRFRKAIQPGVFLHVTLAFRTASP
jgi:hypothetical protein